MTTLQELIRDAADQSEGSESEVRFSNDYSGRGMFGRRCVGIIGSRKGCMQVIAQCIKDAYTESVNDDSIDKDDAVDTLLDFEQDQMGYDLIMYWPGLSSIDSVKDLSYREQ